MSKLEQIEKSVAELDEDELQAFAQWFAELQAERWDRQIEADASQASWTGLPKRLWLTIAPVGPVPFEALRHA